MPNKSKDSPLACFLKGLKAEKIEFILIGMMAAVQQGAPVSTIDFDLWLKLPSRQYIRVVNLVSKLKGSVLAKTVFELRDGSQINIIFEPTGLQSFETELKRCDWAKLDGVSIPVLPLRRVIASKKAADRDKDRAALPILQRTLRLLKKTN